MVMQRRKWEQVHPTNHTLHHQKEFLQPCTSFHSFIHFHSQIHLYFCHKYFTIKHENSLQFYVNGFKPNSFLTWIDPAVL